MRKFVPNNTPPQGIFTEFDPKNYYYGAIIGDKVCVLMPKGYASSNFMWHIVTSKNGNNYGDFGISHAGRYGDEHYEFDTAAELYEWVASELKKRGR